MGRTGTQVAVTAELAEGGGPEGMDQAEEDWDGHEEGAHEITPCGTFF